MILDMRVKRIVALSIVSVFLIAGFQVTSGQFTPAVDVAAEIDRDLRVFTVMAALNASGFDVEFAPQYHPVRQLVREQLTDLDPDLSSRLSEFYEDNRGNSTHEDEVTRYISLALNLTEPPDMALTSQDMFLPPEVRDLTGFVPLLNEFYREANVFQLWARLTPEYDQVLDLIARPLRATVNQTNAYLREVSGSTRTRRLVAYLELAAPINSVQVRNYTDNLYMVFGFSAEVPVNDVRHAYLHLILDDVVGRNRQELRDKDAPADWIRGIDGVRPEYAEDFEIMVAESLIRAVELRMDREGDQDPSLVDSAYRSGLLLTPFFLDQLSDFEQSPVGIREYFPEMALNLDVGLERTRFDDRFDSIQLVVEERAPAEVPAPRPSNPVRDLLVEGQEAFNRGDDEVARDAFETVLYQLESENGPALYGLALIASREADPVAAQTYFVQTLESDSSEPSMRVWSHIYLGRIYDAVECDREAAVEQYESAIALGDDTNGAQAAAQSGLEQAFGQGCDL